MRGEQKTVSLDMYEEGAVIDGLNRIRTEQLGEGGSADFVSELMLKIMKAPTKSARFGAPAKSRGDLAGGGGATEQASFCHDSGEMSKRSPRRRDEAR